MRISIIILFFSTCLFSCRDERSEKKLFTLVPSSDSQIHFRNDLKNTDQFNIIEYLYFYNGGGVAIGDINNDGLSDVYFVSNQGENKLYLNKGDFHFEDITLSANAKGVGNWKTGVSMADVNGDGFLDFYICGVGGYKNFDGRNQLLINNGDLTFSDRTEEWGLSFQGFSTHSVFFDYDNDGDLDMYLLNHSVHTPRSYGTKLLRYENDARAGDRLYRNELIPSGKTSFVDATSSAGIFSSQIGYGLGVAVSDLNRDGFMDIYVSNDFHENDYMYINQGDGTFKQQLEESVPHTSRFSMGVDIADINNDCRPDILTLDMLPKDEKIIKTTAGEDTYDIYKFKLQYGYHYQFSKNALQLNQGLDHTGKLMFSDVASWAGVKATDWSWAPLLADFDNDGFKDIFIANGIMGRPNDLDYINFLSGDSMSREIGDEALINRMPSGKVANFLFKNMANKGFKDISATGLGVEASLSNGAAYADLDNDGDLDLVINNINEDAFVYRNNSQDSSKHFLKVRLVGDSFNDFGIGSKITCYVNGEAKYQEQFLSRGWESSVDPIIHFAFGMEAAIDSIIVVWPNHKYEILKQIKTNQLLELRQTNAIHQWHYENKSASFFERNEEIPFKHVTDNSNPFNQERLIPRSVSTEGPKMAVGDVNSDGIDDFFVGGGEGQSGKLFLQTKSGKFSELAQSVFENDSSSNDTGSVLFDADGNGTLDLLVVSGGQFLKQGTELTPRLYLNSGTGIFKKSINGLPDMKVSSSCVKAADIDNDGDVDLFIGGRVLPGRYGHDPVSYMLVNDGRGRFKDASHLLMNRQLGMVTDACWVDLNKDSRMDMIVVGEWMPITVLMQDKNGFFIETEYAGLKSTNGWWNTIHANDLDNDGDVDFLVGNIGANSRIRVSKNEPARLYLSDIDQNGSDDPILTYYNKEKSYPFISRDQLVKQVPSLKKRFLRYTDFSQVQIEDIIGSEKLVLTKPKEVYEFHSVVLTNESGQLNVKFLPDEAQIFPIFAFEVMDINSDGSKDVLAVGNLYDVQPDQGRYDAGYGLVLLSEGKNEFHSLSPEVSGFDARGEGRDIKLLKGSKYPSVLVARNGETMLNFRIK